jgi:hypothetical protein
MTHVKHLTTEELELGLDEIRLSPKSGTCLTKQPNPCETH